MVNKINSVLKEVLESKNVPPENLKQIDIVLKKFLSDFKEKLKSLKIDADVFVGGSAAKGTMIKKNDYDIDIFVRFDKRYKNGEFATLTKKVLDKMGGKFEVVHGSRDYFKIQISDRLFFEVIPVKKVKSPKEADNITDLSYLHVNYIRKKVKSKKILDEIKLAKAFCYANGCYGAESYIRGFSGYGLELLIHHYGSFLKMARELAKVGKEKVVIDTEKFYKNKNVVLMDLNESKLGSPIILIDPTYKTRNVLAALSEETFGEFQKDLKSFLKNPSAADFERADTEVEFAKAEKVAKKKKYDFVLLESATGKQEGDVAGSKLLKFYNHLSEEVKRFFDIKNCGFEYSGKQSARFFFSVKKKSDILICGPSAEDAANVKRFRAKHKAAFVKGKRVYAKQKVNFSLKEFLGKWKKENGKRMKEMSVSNLSLMS
ncbi:MAG: nucleotidyltransferase domain-containing protein [Nanoarchaeota archaeon]|nr:nucleotidyltransferase domain-containing protein [Nanoarchaeota archaeon]